LDAAGFETIIVETAGAGQSEVEIAQTAQTVVVVEAPGMGDEVQAIKAGILEIADVFAVNKADRAGADQTASALEMMLDLSPASSLIRRGQSGRVLMHHGRLMEVAQRPNQEDSDSDGWRPPVLKTIALRGEGIPELVRAIADHRHHLEATGELASRNRTRLANELEHILRDELTKRLLDEIDQIILAELLAQVAARQLDPYTAAQHLMAGGSHA
jgi:LAO/AO transport system kinase